ncbi:hypothetical protein KIPB_012710, partial [Kipferlia bialata]
CLVPPNQNWAKHAPVLLLTVAKETFTHNNNPNRTCDHDLGLMMATMSVQATSMGLHMHQMAGVLLDKVTETYSIPEGYHPLTAAAIGYKATQGFPDQMLQKDASERSRRAISDTFFGSAFGQGHSSTQ